MLRAVIPTRRLGTIDDIVNLALSSSAMPASTSMGPSWSPTAASA